MARSFKVLAIHKQMFPATYNFKDEVVGTTGTDIDFVDVVTDSTEVSIIASFGSHKKVLQNADTDGANTVTNTITQRDSGVIEFYYSSNDVTARTNIQTYEDDVGIIIYLRMRDNELKYYVGAVLTATGLTMVNNQIYLIKLQLYADNTYDYWIDGTQYADGVAVNNDMVSGIDGFRISTYLHTDYFDAIGYSWDANYKIGDNVHWRHYKESEADTFEEDDTGTQGTSITWVDTVDTAASFELVNEFNEHKKILRGYYSSGAGGDDNCYHTFATQAKTGWFEGWIKASDATINSTINLREDNTLVIGFRIESDQFQVYTGGAWRQATGSPTPADGTWYHFYIQWYDAATDTFDLWIDNVQYEDGTNCQANQTSGINICRLYCYSATEYAYLDAPSSSLDGDSKADNRLFDYNDSYTREDITSDIINVLYKNKVYGWREAIMASKEVYENSEIFVQVYDINDKLAMEADLKNRSQVGATYEYPLRDKNQDDLENRSSNTFVLNKIHDPTDSTCILKVILPNVSEADGDLLLVDADTKATTYSPVTKNYPDGLMLRDVSDLADSVVIVHADGKCYLDDDKASGTVLDYDTAADFDKMTQPILVTDILETINYFEIFGAINTETGARFYKVIDNVGDDKKRSWRYTNNEFKNQTDVDAYAAALVARATAIKLIKFTAQSLGAHNMGETVDYKYVNSLYNVPQGNYYVIFEEIDFDQNLNTIILSEGMIEDSKYAAGFERSEEYSDSLAYEIYETDIITISLPLLTQFGSAWADHGILCNTNESAAGYIYLSDNTDPDRDAIITIIHRNPGAATTIDGVLYVFKYACDASADFTTPVNALNFDFVTTAQFGRVAGTYTLSATHIEANSLYQIRWTNVDASNAEISAIQVQYYAKRTV